MSSATEVYYKTIETEYDNLKNICREVCKRNNDTFSEDTFHDTLIKVGNIISSKGELKDMSKKGISNYLTRSYVNNLRCERRNSYVCKRDWNITQDEINHTYEKSGEALRDKLIKDLLEDFSILYIMKSVEDNFDEEGFYLYRLKTLSKLTYKQIYDKTHIKKAREKILCISRWVKDNISRHEINEVFNDVYGNLIV